MAAFDNVIDPPYRTADVVAALDEAAERFDRIRAVEIYRAYERAAARAGESPDDDVVIAYRKALWCERPVARAEGPLPQPGTPYFGRERETAHVSTLVSSGAGLVTVTGNAGVGKTRTILAAADRARASFADDVRYVEVESDYDLSMAMSRMRFDEIEDRERRILLVVDGARIASGPVRESIRRFLRAHPRATVLAASRSRLRIDHERVVELAPFALPLADASPPVIARTPAIRFFIERASVAATYLFDNSDAFDVARLCASLDGLPLALELAAAQLRFFSLRELCARVASPAFLPTSLESTLRGSLDLLDRDERALFHRLAVFEAPWTLAEAEAVCAGDGLNVADIAPAAMRLHERSLVHAERRGGTTRYRYLETVRRVATASGETERSHARERAVAWYLEEMMRPGLDGIPDANQMAVLAERTEALAHVLDRWCRDDERVLRAIVSTRKFWEWRGLAGESLARIDARRAAVVSADRDLAFAIARTITTHALVLGENERVAEGIRAMESFVNGDLDRAIETTHNAAILAYNTGRLDDAVRSLEAVAAMQERGGAPCDRSRTIMNLAAIDMARCDWTGAERRLASIAHLDLPPNEAVFVVRNRAYAAAMRGEIVGARAFAAEAVRRCQGREIALEWRVELEHARGIIEMRAGDAYAAIRHQQAALLMTPRLPLRLSLLPIEHAALAARVVGFEREALRLLAYVGAVRERTGLKRSQQFEEIFASARADLLAACGDDAAQDVAIGATLSAERASEIVFSLPSEARRRDPLAVLTDRERDVAGLIATGASNREIAQKLVISVKTVENHLASMFQKLEVSRRAHIAIIVVDARAGLEKA